MKFYYFYHTTIGQLFNLLEIITRKIYYVPLNSDVFQNQLSDESTFTDFKSSAITSNMFLFKKEFFHSAKFRSILKNFYQNYFFETI